MTGLLKHSAFSINIKIITSLVQLEFLTPQGPIWRVLNLPIPMTFPALGNAGAA